MDRGLEDHSRQVELHSSDEPFLNEKELKTHLMCRIFFSPIIRVNGWKVYFKVNFKFGELNTKFLKQFITWFLNSLFSINTLLLFLRLFWSYIHVIVIPWSIPRLTPIKSKFHEYQKIQTLTLFCIVLGGGWKRKINFSFFRFSESS